jgi:hypothetical protein
MQVLHELDKAVESEKAKQGKKPSRIERIQPYIARSIGGVAGLFLLLWIAASLSSINSKIQDRPILAEIDGQVHRMKELPAGERSPAVIRGHIAETLSSLLWLNNQLPGKYGGKIVPPVKVPGIETLMPRITAIAASNIVDENRLSTLQQIAKKIPNLEAGESKMLRIYNLELPKQTEGGYSVKMYASIWRVGKDSIPLDYEEFNRVVHLKSVFVTPEANKDPLTASILLDTVKNGLMIDYLEPFKD